MGEVRKMVKALCPPEDKEALRSDGGGKDDTTEYVPPDEAVLLGNKYSHLSDSLL